VNSDILRGPLHTPPALDGDRNTLARALGEALDGVSLGGHDYTVLDELTAGAPEVAATVASWLGRARAAERAEASSRTAEREAALARIATVIDQQRADWNQDDDGEQLDEFNKAWREAWVEGARAAADAVRRGGEQ
jgi:hypothetical protein